MPVHYDNIPLVWTQFLNSDVPLSALYENSMLLMEKLPIDFDWTPCDDVPERTWFLHMLARFAFTDDISPGMVHLLFSPKIQHLTSLQLIELGEVPIKVVTEITELYKNWFDETDEAPFVTSGWLTKLEEILNYVFAMLHTLTVNAINDERTRKMLPLHKAAAASYLDKRNWHRTSDDGNWVHNNGSVYDEMDHDGLLPWQDDEGNDMTEEE
jgi:hypothetical protein